MHVFIQHALDADARSFDTEKTHSVQTQRAASLLHALRPCAACRVPFASATTLHRYRSSSTGTSASPTPNSRIRSRPAAYAARTLCPAAIAA